MWQPIRVVDAIDYAANDSVGLIGTGNRTVIIEPEARDHHANDSSL